MANKGTPETDPRERTNFIPRVGKEEKEKGTVCDRAVSKIKALAGEITFLRVIAFLYRVVILFLLIGIGIAVAMAAKMIQQLTLHMNSAATCGPPCPRYWIGYEGKCYFFSKEKRNWTYSQKFCSLHNATLVKIEGEELEIVMRLIGKDLYWIGLQKHPGKPWTWSDGANSVMEVSGEGGDCAYLDNDARAISSGCHTKLPWICSKPAAYTIPSNTPDP
ncbi:C-type lectin domain family 2 member D-like [Varanus komodoensis]|uniref:C-type lectin domain-containing protein n=1 Tax=Varanus komodoensis TaxID=61221 RepID=A0A8D2L731_VARKO|nr:C-type lectin domain family 2 member D-like [Varanus komodoensis]